MNRKHRTCGNRAIALLIFLVYPLAAQSQINLSLSAYSLESVERCPIVFRVVISNNGNNAIIGPLKPDDEFDARRLCAVTIRDSSGRSNIIAVKSGSGGPHVLSTAPVLDIPFPPGAVLAFDCIVVPIIRMAPPPRWAGEAHELYAYLAPGTYTLQAGIYWGAEEELRSNEVEVRIVAAEPSYAGARDHLKYTHAGFLAGDDRPSVTEDYARETNGRINVSRFKEIEGILEQFPSSPYAEWIRFWKVYHHGPMEAMLRYAREHPEFPLSDNLMLRAADGLFEADRHGESREVVEELLRLFPNGDTRQPAERLREKLRNRP